MIVYVAFVRKCWQPSLLLTLYLYLRVAIISSLCSLQVTTCLGLATGNLLTRTQGVTPTTSLHRRRRHLLNSRPASLLPIFQWAWPSPSVAPPPRRPSTVGFRTTTAPPSNRGRWPGTATCPAWWGPDGKPPWTGTSGWGEGEGQGTIHPEGAGYCTRGAERTGTWSRGTIRSFKDRRSTRKQTTSSRCSSPTRTDNSSRAGSRTYPVLLAPSECNRYGWARNGVH